MDKHENSVKDKTLDAYSKYIRGEYCLNVISIVLKGDKVAYIKNLANGNLTLPCGAVYDNEEIEQAAVRSAFEKAGLKVKPVMPIDKENYKVDMKIGDIEFASNRIAYGYLCELLEENMDEKENNSELKNKVKVYFDEIDNLSELDMSDQAIERIKQYIKAEKKL